MILKEQELGTKISTASSEEQTSCVCSGTDCEMDSCLAENLMIDAVSSSGAKNMYFGVLSHESGTMEASPNTL
jgi:hypothetical protein